jgi:hypothetical protein
MAMAKNTKCSSHSGAYVITKSTKLREDGIQKSEGEGAEAVHDSAVSESVHACDGEDDVSEHRECMTESYKEDAGGGKPG